MRDLENLNKEYDYIKVRRDNLIQFQNTINSIVIMCDDRLSILNEEDDYHDPDIREGLDEQIKHFTLLKEEAKEKLKIINNYLK